MKIDDLILVSVDDHVIEPGHIFERHLPAKYQHAAPRLLTGAKGDNFWLYEGKKLPNIGLNAVVGRVPEEYGCEPNAFDQVRRGTWDIHARIEDMNVNGLLGSMCFGSFVRFDGSLFLGASDKDMALHMLRAYNDWHIDEWCGTYPGRFIPLAILPVWDVNLVVEEVRRVARKGCHAVSFSDNPSLKGLPSIHDEYWEPFWQVCVEEQVVICCHIGSGFAPPYPSMDSPIDAWIVGMPMAIAFSAADWLYLKAFQKYPTLKVALTEGGIGWIPYFLERADFTFAHHGAWTHSDFGDRKPSDVFRDHFLTCFIDDRFGVENRHTVGINSICYECDYPHSDTLWPDAPERLLENFVGVSDEEIDLMTHLNAMRAFSYDPFSILGRENCTVGALRAQAAHVDTRPRSFGGPSPLAPGESPRVVTSRDVIKLFAPEDYAESN